MPPVGHCIVCDLPLGLLHSDNGIALDVVVVVLVVAQDAIQASFLSSAGSSSSDTFVYVHTPYAPID